MIEKKVCDIPRIDLTKAFTRIKDKHQSFAEFHYNVQTDSFVICLSNSESVLVCELTGREFEDMSRIRNEQLSIISENS